MSNYTDYKYSGNQTQPMDSQLEKIDITNIVDDMFKALTRFWWLIIIIVSVTSTIFYFQRKLTYKAKYEASATYTVNANSPYTYSSNYYDQTTAQNLGTTMEYLLNSASMKRIVAEDLGVKKLPGKIKVSCLESTNILTISTTSSDRQAAYNMLQSILSNYQSVCSGIIGNTVLTEMDQSGVPTYPVNPEDCKGAAKTGLVMGLVISIAFLIFLALVKRTIRKEEDFERVLNIECYGAIPLARFKKRGKNMGEKSNLVLIDNYRIPGGFLESIRAIRTRLERDAIRHNYKTFLITSAIPGEGKSTVSSNIALGLARKGKSVILVDFDLRSPSIGEYMDIETNGVGTAEVLLGRANLEDALVSYKKLPLRILPGVERMSDTMRILNSEALGELVKQLESMADYVILDTPPSAMLADAALIARHADAAVFVVRQDYSQVKDILEGVGNLTEEGISISGCILNQAEVGITGYGYGYGYGYGRGYGLYGNSRSYGDYGNSKKNKQKTTTANEE